MPLTDSSRLSNSVMEFLEQRQLFNATVPLEGDYIDGNGNRLSILPSHGSEDRIKLQVVKDDENTGVTQTLITECYVDFEQKGSGASTIFQADLPVSTGVGTLMVSVSPAGIKTVDENGTIDPRIFVPIDLPTDSFSPLPAPTGNSSVTQSVIATPPLEADSVSKNDLLGGVYLGTFRRTTDNQLYKLKVSFSLNKKGHLVMEADFIIPGFGDMIIDTVVHPTHTGTFSVPLGDNALAGSFSAHLSHTGRLVSRLAVPELSIETGSLKKHGS